MSFYLLIITILAFFGFFMGYNRAKSIQKTSRTHSLPRFYGLWLVLWCTIPSLIFLIAWMLFGDNLVYNLTYQYALDNLPLINDESLKDTLNILFSSSQDFQNNAGQNTDLLILKAYYDDLNSKFHWITILFLLVLFLGLTFIGLKKINPNFKARDKIEKATKILLILCSCIAIFTTVGIVITLFAEAYLFFDVIPVSDFLFGTEWSPQTSIRSDQVGSSGKFGIIPLLTGTLLITFIALLVATPIGLFSAIYMSEYAPRKVRSTVKPILEILAGVPTVVFGFFAALTVAPFLRNLGADIGLNVASESALAAGLVMGIMIIPFISSLSDDIINAVPQSLRDGSYALGSTKSETIKKVVLAAALPGIVASVLLAISRAIGETMIVVMAAGLRANLTANPLEDVTTFTVQIVTLLTGDQEFNSPKTLAAFALGLILFIMTLFMNIIALRVVRKYREKYD